MLVEISSTYRKMFRLILIVRIEECHIVATAHLYADIPRHGKPAIGREMVTNPVIATNVFANDSECIIARSIADDQKLPIAEGLPHHAFSCSTDAIHTI